MRTEYLINALVADLTVSKVPIPADFRWRHSIGLDHRRCRISALDRGSSRHWPSATDLAILVQVRSYLGSRHDSGRTSFTPRNPRRFDRFLGVGLLGDASATRRCGSSRTHRHAGFHMVAQARGIECPILLDPDPASIDRPLGVHITCFAARRANKARPCWRCSGTRSERYCSDALCVPLH